jgi:hypothetical protein
VWGIESIYMRSRLRLIVKCLVSLCAALLVGLALWRAQYPGETLWEFATTASQALDESTKHGWPAFWILRLETGDDSVPGLSEFDTSVLPGDLAVDLAAWIAVLMATAYVSWRMCSCRGQFSLRFLFSMTTAVAILLAWWRIEVASCSQRGFLSSKRGFLLSNETAIAYAQTPMLRMLQFPPSVYIPVLLGFGCLTLCTIDVTFFVLHGLSRFKKTPH